jgi:hypothetical protein
MVLGGQLPLNFTVTSRVISSLTATTAATYHVNA